MSVPAAPATAVLSALPSEVKWLCPSGLLLLPAAQYCQSRTTCNAPVLEHSGMRVACRSVYRRTCCDTSKLPYFASFDNPLDVLGSLLSVVSAIPKLPPTAATLLPARQHASQMCKTCSSKLREEAQIINLEHHIPASAPCAPLRDDMMVRQRFELAISTARASRVQQAVKLLTFVHSVRYTVSSIASTPVTRSPWLLQWLKQTNSLQFFFACTCSCHLPRSACADLSPM